MLLAINITVNIIKSKNERLYEHFTCKYKISYQSGIISSLGCNFHYNYLQCLLNTLSHMM